ncbi:MAG: hypothetical protein JWM53_5007, partial [bacterium]|nr:hypothetical protein [bacterium]
RMEEDAERLIEAARQEAQARADAEIAAASPVAAIATLAVAALLAVAGLGAWLMHAEDAAVARSRARAARIFDEERAAVVAQEQGERQRFEAEMGRLKQRLASAATQAERERVQQKMAEASLAHLRRAHGVKSQVAKKEPVKNIAPAGLPGPLLDSGATLLGD